ncbi:ATP-dependent RNA helicase Mss116 [Schizosaccharomyces cryophilus OY26]|uniref:RNA helicase n=1 Tax=Schizosaccharomyces cryophilus (strain OY26 / ATCC MYA-4695 / CBS 11777 / NBRC 106824 / NRRL Y48691) TaxID=653667 RepID=S9WWY0_SCHCR|nr:ATP-dependent RNA helicase Mss116 [Schizosaccharomyces cryophilus OY26]EPY49242.1 ATP-dependent RNA helicase Mss116 [Schizosaccharomyces cryophilus OY26]
MDEESQLLLYVSALKRCPSLRFQSFHRTVSTSKEAPTETSTETPTETPTEVLFSEIRGIPDSLKRNLTDRGFSRTTPVQGRVIQEVLPDNENAVVQAKTGTGKTLAFLLVAIKDMLKGKPSLHSKKIHSVILSPTRELALQIFEEAKKLTPGTGIKTTFTIGGNSKMSESNSIRKGFANILIATPGRINDHLTNPEVRNALSVNSFVLDEADRLMDMGFADTIKDIHRDVARPFTRRLCFSATMPPKVSDVFEAILGNKIKIVNCLDPNEPPTHERVPQFVVKTELDSLFHDSLALLQELSQQPSPRIIVFLPTIGMADFLADLFQSQLDIPCYALHSRLATGERRRITDKFRRAPKGILFATDVVARGMDFPNISQVVQIFSPSAVDDYIHRIGRTGRAGKSGESYLVVPKQEQYFLRSLSELPIQDYSVDGLSDEEIIKYNKNMQDISSDMRIQTLKTLYAAKSQIFEDRSQTKNSNELVLKLFGLEDEPAAKQDLMSSTYVRNIINKSSRMPDRKNRGYRQTSFKQSFRGNKPYKRQFDF